MLNRFRQSWTYAALRHVKAIPATVSLVCACIGVLVLWQGESWRAEYIGIAVLNGVYWILILHLIWHIIGHRCPEFFGIPRVRKTLRSDGLLIVEKSPWLGIGVMTTIYVVEEEYERLVCVGEVVNVQYNDLVQIAIRVDEQGYMSNDEIWNTLDRTDKKLLLVKPGPYRGGA